MKGLSDAFEKWRIKDKYDQKIREEALWKNMINSLSESKK